MADETLEVAVLFADVSGSTRLYETVGDQEALAGIAKCLTLIASVCQGRGGRVIKTVGDEVMAIFPTADAAAEAAAEMQGRISELPAVGRTRLAIRVGFHYGPAIEADGDVYGDSVNVAARMAALAKGDQVILTAYTASILTPLLRTRVREIDLLTVRGKHKDITIFELIWQDSEEDSTTLSPRYIPGPAQLRLRHGSREIDLGEANSIFTLGRDQQNDAVISDRMASRMHARIERRRDKFVLIDQSSNGTYVTIEGEPEVLLRREEITLRGHGHVVFGHAYQDDPSEILAFWCES